MPDFNKVAKVSEVPEGKMKVVSVDGEDICLFNTGGKIHACEESCPHQEGPMHEGTIEDGSIICPWHPAKFDIETGRVDKDIDFVKQGLKIYEVKIEGEDVLVKV